MATSTQRFRLVGDDDASSAFLKVAAAARLTKTTMDDLGSASLGLTKAIGGAGLIPIAAGAAAAVTELGTSLGAAAGAAGIFGLSAGGFLTQMVKQQQSIATTRTSLNGLTKGTTEYHDALVKLHTKQQLFNQEFGPAAKGFDDMKLAFQNFLHATGPVTKGVLAKGFELIASVLPKLAPVSNAAGKAIGGLIDDLSHWTKSPEFSKLLDWLQRAGPKAITTFGHSIGNIAHGLGEFFANFAGPGEKASKTLEHLTRSFDKWAGSKGVSQSVQKFLNYVSSNGGNITQTLQSLAEAAPKIAVALGKLGSANLSLTTKALTLIAGLPQGAFNAVADGLFGIYVASKALTIVQGLNTLFTGAAAAMTALKDACLLTRIQLGLLLIQEKLTAAATKIMAAGQWLLNAALDANPIGIVVVALAALAAGLVYAYKHSETFRKIVDGALHGVVAAAKAMWTGAKAAFDGFVSAMKNVGAAVNNVVGFIRAHWKLIVSILGGPMVAAAVLIISNFDKIKAGVSNAIGAVLGFLRSIPGKIKSALGNLGSLLYDAGSQLIQGLIDGIQSKVNDLMAKVSSVGGAVKGGFKKVMGIFSPSKVFRGYGQNLMDGLMQGIADRELSLQAALGKVGDLISKVGEKISTLMSTRSNFLGTFTPDNLFGTDLSQGGDITTLITAQQGQAAQAKQLLRDIRSVTKMGLSKALIRQLQAQGTSGAAALHALAMGDPAQIKLLNRLNKQTSDSLRAAGLRAGNYVRGGSINDDIRRARKEEHVLELLEHHLHDLVQTQKKDQTIIVEIDSEAVIRHIRRRNQRKGVKSAGI